MIITNQKMVQWLNCIGGFSKIENEHGSALLNPKGEYALACNRKILLNAYDIYSEVLEKVKDDKAEVDKLLEQEIEIDDIKPITVDELKDGVTSLAMQYLDFMLV